MRSVRDIKELRNIPVIVRAALNVPVENGVVVNDYRLRRALPTIQFLLEGGARVVLISHMGEAGTETLEPVANALDSYLGNVSFCTTTIGVEARAAVRALPAGSMLVMENLRRNAGEVGNDRAFAQELAALGDIFVQDSFDTCHRKHASIVTLPTLLPSYAGLVVEEEVMALSGALTPKHPGLAVVGGAKFSTKEAVLTTLLKTYDHVFVGGALASDFLKAGGHEVGASLTSATDSAGVRELLGNPKLVLPVDALVVPKDSVDALDARERAHVVSIDQIGKDDFILDHGPGTLALISELAQKSRSIMWNGPLGLYEKGFVDTTDGFARAVAASDAHSVVGGGDTVASIQNLGLMTRFSFVSTGGGAMLEFLARGSLPGIDAIEHGYGSD